MDDQSLVNMITLLPNFAVGLVMLYWQRQTIDRLLETQSKLIERLVKYADHERIAATATASGGGDAIVEA